MQTSRFLSAEVTRIARTARRAEETITKDTRRARWRRETRIRPSSIGETAPFQTVKVALLLLADFSIGDLSAIADALDLANRDATDVSFSVTVCGLGEGGVKSSCGIGLSCTAISHHAHQDLKLIIIGPQPQQKILRGKLAGLIEEVRRGSGFVGAVGPSVEILADLGVLDGARASAHWRQRQHLRTQYPNVDFTDHIFLIDEKLGTCAGAATAADFALEFVSKFTDQTFARALSQKLKCQPKRESMRQQRESRFSQFAGAHEDFLSAVSLVESAPIDGLDVAKVASSVGVSTRQLQRLFRQYLQMTPRQYLQVHRLKQARDLLMRTPMTIIEVSASTGFSSPSHFSRRYYKAFGQTPSRARHQSWVANAASVEFDLV